MESHLKKRDEIYSHRDNKKIWYTLESQNSFSLEDKSEYCYRGERELRDTGLICIDEREHITYFKGIFHI